MKQFDGRWAVQPFTQATLDHIYRPHQEEQQAHAHGWFNPASALSAISAREWGCCRRAVGHLSA
jgi:hypothetical protein